MRARRARARIVGPVVYRVSAYGSRSSISRSISKGKRLERIYCIPYTPDRPHAQPRTRPTGTGFYSSVSKLQPFSSGRSPTLHTDRAQRHSCSRYIRARGAGPPEAIGEAGGRPRNRSSHPAAQCALPPPWPSVCVSRALMAISRLALALAMHCECITHLKRISPDQSNLGCLDGFKRRGCWGQGVGSWLSVRGLVRWRLCVCVPHVGKVPVPTRVREV